MSLFQARTWWSCRGNTNVKCMVVCNIDNALGAQAGNKIVLGGLDGGNLDIRRVGLSEHVVVVCLCEPTDKYDFLEYKIILIIHIYQKNFF